MVGLQTPEEHDFVDLCQEIEAESVLGLRHARGEQWVLRSAVGRRAPRSGAGEAQPSGVEDLCRAQHRGQEHEAVSQTTTASAG